MQQDDRFQFPVNRYFPEWMRFTHPLAREFLSEFACTALFLCVGVGCVIQWNTSAGKFDTFLSLNICWGFAVMFGAGLGIGTSGGHMNPAITFSQFLLGRKKFIHVIVYSIAQVLGAMFGTAIAYGNYQEALNNFDGGHRVARGPTGSLCFLVTCPQDYETQWAGILDQVVGTGILTVQMASMIDTRNGVPIFLHPMFGGFTVMMIGMGYGQNDGYPINPARDLGARLIALMIYGADAFKDRNYWFWVPIVGPLVGGSVGAWLYNLLFDFHTPKRPEKDNL